MSLRRRGFPITGAHRGGLATPADALREGTLTPGQAARRSWDAIVAGAGPAGAMLAGKLVAAGMRTLIVDRSAFPRSKACGCCLSARTVGELEDAGLGGLAAGIGGPRLRSLRLAAWGRGVDLVLSGGLAVSRRALDAALLGVAIAGGAHFLPRQRVALGELAEDGREVWLHEGGEARAVRAAVVIDATGLGGALIGVPRASGGGGPARLGAAVVLDATFGGYAPGIVHMAVGTAGYVGLTRLEDGRLNVAAALDAGAVRAVGMGAAATDVLREAGLELPPGLAAAAWSGTPRLRRQVPRQAASRLFAVGDAAGYVEPFTGEGIGWALRSARLLAPLVQRAANRWSPQLADHWNVTHAGELARAQRACRALAWLLRRPRAVRGIVRVLQRRPALGTPFVRHVYGAGVAAEGSAWP